MPIAPVPTYDEFITRFPAFASMDNTQVEAQIVRSSNFLYDKVWDDQYGEGILLDSAHTLALMQQACEGGVEGAFQGAAGPVNSASAAGVSIGFAQPSWNDKSAVQSWYSKTVYGQQLLMLWRVVAPMGCLSI